MNRRPGKSLRPGDPRRIVARGPDDQPILCAGRHPNEYVAGIDFYCDGVASRLPVRHDRYIVGKFRHSTCSASQLYREQQEEAHEWWMSPLDNGNVPEELGWQDVAGVAGRLLLICELCTVEAMVGVGRMDRLMHEVWREHAGRREPRNVATLLDS